MSNPIVCNLFASIVINGATSKFFELSPDWFLTKRDDAEVYSEIEIYDLFSDYIKLHNRVPSFEYCQERQLPLPTQVDETLESYILMMKNRAIGNFTKELFTKLSKNSRTNDWSDVPALLKESVSKLNFNIRSNDLQELRHDATATMTEYYQNKGRTGMKGITSGWKCLDDVTYGLQGGDLIVIVARPNVGKSYLLFHMAMAAYKDGKSAMVTSMEMSRSQVSKRLVAIYSQLNPDYITRGRLSPQYERLLESKVNALQVATNFHIMSGDMKRSVADIDLAIQQVSPDIAFIDAAYLLKPDKIRRTSDARREVISDVFEDLKKVAVARNIPIVMTTQFNRQVKKKSKSDLDLSNIAETDVIGQIASVVMGVRPGNVPNEKETRIIEVIKNREGSLLKFAVNFEFAGMDFSDIGIVESQSHDTSKECEDWMV